METLKKSQFCYEAEGWLAHPGYGYIQSPVEFLSRIYFKEGMIIPVIKNLRIPKFGPHNKGLAEVDVANLTEIVVLAGPNGAGKSCLLGILNEGINLCSSSEIGIINSRLSHFRAWILTTFQK
jgi:hypothetical protein